VNSSNSETAEAPAASTPSPPAIAPPQTANRQDITLGLVFMAIGGLFAADVFLGVNIITGEWNPLPRGTARQMGPGFLPLGLAGILILLGAIIAAKGVVARVPAEARRPIPWRPILILVPLPIIFGLTVGGLGLIVPVFVTAFVAGFASRKVTILSSLAVAVGMTVFCALVFYKLAQITTPPIGPWLEFLRPALAPILNFLQPGGV
jgi:hypothetical protein